MGTTASTTLSAKISRLRQRPDFHRSPFAAMARRLWWRTRWALSKRPWRLKLGDNLEILAPKGGAGALIYYQGGSEPETARLLRAFLKPGMTFWDVGAHIGEFSLLGSRCVGLTGRVHAFEPQPKIFELLQRNIVANGLTNIAAHHLALSDQVGSAELSLNPEPSMSFLKLTGFVNAAFPSVSVSTTSLDEVERSLKQVPDLIKVDVEGAERFVLAGGESLLRLPPESAPAWIMEFDASNCARFGYRAKDLLTSFSDHGFNTYWIRTEGQLDPTSSATVTARNLFAAKNAGDQ